MSGVSKRRLGGLRFLASLLALVVAAIGCTSGPADTTDIAPTTSPGVQNPKAMMDTALGGTQTVQDFLVFIAMSTETSGGPVSFYENVVEMAASGAGETVALPGGFTFTPVDSIAGDIADSEGRTLPNLSLDFGLLGLSDDRFDEALAELTDEVEAAGALGLRAALESLENDGSELLVEVATADFSASRSHVGPGDVARADFGFVSALEAGQQLTYVYLFGQTVPGDPEREDGLSPLELFSYRLTEGLFLFLGDADGLSLAVDQSQTVIDGLAAAPAETEVVYSSTTNASHPMNAAAAANDRHEEASAAGEVPCCPLVLKAAALLETRISGVAAGIALMDKSIGEAVASARATGEVTSFKVRGTPVYADPDGSLAYFSAIDRKVEVDRERLTMLNGADAGWWACVNDARSLLLNNEDPDSQNWIAATGVQLCGPSPFESSDPKPRGGTFGDVHFSNFDGWSYDSQAAGEFLIFENGATSVQLRAEPLPGSEVVSIATAVAAGVGDHTISMHLGGDTWIDGEPVEIRRGETIAVGDAALLWSGGTWVIVWPDGTMVKVSDAQQTAVDGVGQVMLFVTSSASPSRGMLGNADGDPTNDWVTRTGTQLPSDIRYDFESFYPDYVDTWRITAEESLFHYGPGESTQTFSIEGFPSRLVTIDDLEPEARTEAEAVCEDSGITREDLLEDCILDVALTGDTSFAFATYLAEAETSPPSPTDQPGTKIDTPPAGGASSVTIGPLTVGFGPVPPVQAENSFAPQWSCQVTEGSFRATSRFQETPDRLFDITIDYLDTAISADGTERFTMTIELNSDPYAWMLTTLDPPPGSIESLALDGPTLTVTGTAFLNDPVDSSLFPFSVLPKGTQFEPFSLQTTCDK